MLSMTILGEIFLVHSNCLEVSLWMGLHSQSPASNLWLLKQELHTSLFIILFIFVENSVHSELKPEIIVTGLFNAQDNHAKPLDTPIYNSEW